VKNKSRWRNKKQEIQARIDPRLESQAIQGEHDAEILRRIGCIVNEAICKLILSAQPPDGNQVSISTPMPASVVPGLQQSVFARSEINPNMTLLLAGLIGRYVLYRGAIRNTATDQR
jgi:hypothetical protein